MTCFPTWAAPKHAFVCGGRDVAEFLGGVLSKTSKAAGGLPQTVEVSGFTATHIL